MANNIKYLDQKGLKTFHDATGWVTIEIPVNGKFVVYDESPIKFINGGLMDIGNIPNQGISVGDVKRFARGTLIVNKANSEIKLEIFTRHYNQLIQHEFKTDKLTLPGTTSQVVLGDGSLKKLKDLVVGGTKNAENIKIIEDVKEGLILSPIASTKIPLLGIYGSYDYNTPRKIDDVFLNINNSTPNEFHITADLYVGSMDDSGFTRGNIYGNLNGNVNGDVNGNVTVLKDDASVLYLTGCNTSNILHKGYRVGTGRPEDLEENIYMWHQGENNLYSPNLHTKQLHIKGGTENEVLQGTGQSIAKSELKVGGADNLKITENPGKYWTGTNLNPVGNKLYLSGYQSLDNNYAPLISTTRVYISTPTILSSMDNNSYKDTLYVNDEEVATKDYINSLTATSDDIERIFNKNTNNTNI